MVHRIGLESVRIAVGPRLLLDDVTLGIEDELRMNVLGPNGAGKFMLLVVLAGAREVDGGRVTRAGGTRVAMLRQADDLPGATTVRRDSWWGRNSSRPSTLASTGKPLKAISGRYR